MFLPKPLVFAAAFSLLSPAVPGGTLPASRSGSNLPRHIMNIEHLPSPKTGKVGCMYRDMRGFLWFGTTKGLYRYDGYDIRVFEFGSSKYDGSRFVTSILQYGSDSLLLATWNGLWLFNIRNEEVTPFLSDVKFGDGRIACVIGDSAHRIWIGTMSNGLFCFDRQNGSMRTFTREDGLSSSDIRTLLMDRSGVLWAGTLRGLNALDPATGRVVQYRSDPGNERSLSSDEINIVYDDGRGTLWAGTHNGLNALDRRSGRIKRFFLLPGVQNEVLAITGDPSGRLWLEVSGAGLFEEAGYRFTRLSPPLLNGSGLKDPYLTSLYVDPSSGEKDVLLWVGARGGDIDKIRVMRNPFMSYSRGNTWPILGTGAVLSLHEDRKGTLWVGLWGGGLNALRVKDGRYVRTAHYAHGPGDPSGIPDNNVTSICEDREGALWIGTYDGLAVMNPGGHRFVVFKHIAGDSTTLPSDYVTKVRVDRSGRVWIATNGGLSLLIRGTPARFENFLHRPQDAHLHGRFIGGNIVSDFREDRTGRIWASMYGGGINRIETGGAYTRFRFAADTDGTHENWVHAIQEDGTGQMALYTAAGLLTLDPSTGSFSRIPAGELDEAHVFDMFDDTRGFRWFSASIGLVRMDLRTRRFTRYDESYGIPINELTSQFCATTDGRLVVGGLNGFTEFRPDSMTTTGSVPPVAITGFSIFDRAMPASFFTTPGISLTYDENFISMSFAVLDFSDPRRNSYAYRMSGLDTGWVYAGRRNVAIYTNIDPGAYEFQVKGANSDEVWNEAGTSLSISITPPFWRTWWFRALAAAALLALMYASYRYRMNHLLQIERLRLRIANDLHDDVGSNLSAIAIVSRAAERSPELSRSTRHKIGEIYNTAVLTSESMKDLVWLIKPENDSFDDLYVRMKETASMLLGETVYSFHAPKAGEKRTIPIDFKRSVFLAFKEVITNIARHAAASSVEIELSLEDHVFTFSVRDNGKGFVAGDATGGNGLGNLRRRAEGIGGTCAIASEPGKGTSVRFYGRL